MSRRRQKGQGRLLKRGCIWYARWRVNGRECTRSLGTQDGREAERLLDEMMSINKLKAREERLIVLKHQIENVHEEIRDRIDAAQSLPLGAMAKAFVDSPRRPDCGSGMLRNYCTAVDKVAEFFGAEREARTVSDVDAEAYARHIGSSITPNTYNKHLNALTAVWRILAPSIGGGEKVVNPWSTLTRKRQVGHGRRALTDAECRRLLNVAEGEVRLLIAVGLYTGLRLADACALRKADLSGDELRIRTRKTGARVAIPIHSCLKAIIAETQTDESSVYLMPEIASRHLRNPSGVSKQVRKAFTVAQISERQSADGMRKRTDCSFHSLRHTFVTRAIEAGVPQPMVQALVGHASAMMTEHYTHIGEGAILKAFLEM